MRYVVGTESTVPSSPVRGNRGRYHVLLGKQSGVDVLELLLVILAPRSGEGPYHYHSDSANVVSVTAGVARVRVDGDTLELGPGEAVYIGPDVPHAISNFGDCELRLLEVKVPPDTDFIILPDEIPSDERQ